MGAVGRAEEVGTSLRAAAEQQQTPLGESFDSTLPALLQVGRGRLLRRGSSSLSVGLSCGRARRRLGRRSFRGTRLISAPNRKDERDREECEENGGDRHGAKPSAP